VQPGYGWVNPPFRLHAPWRTAVGVESDGAENMGPKSPPPSAVSAVPAALSPVHTGGGDW
jgi:hypothetical protein